MSATEGRVDPVPGRPDHEGAWSGKRDTILPEEQTPRPQTPQPQTPPESAGAVTDDDEEDPDTGRPTPE